VRAAGAFFPGKLPILDFSGFLAPLVRAAGVFFPGKLPILGISSF